MIIEQTFFYDLSWYVPNNTPIIHHLTIFREHFISRAPTDLSYKTRSGSVRDKDALNKWFLDSGVKAGIDVPI